MTFIHWNHQIQNTEKVQPQFWRTSYFKSPREELRTRLFRKIRCPWQNSLRYIQRETPKTPHHTSVDFFQSKISSLTVSVKFPQWSECLLIYTRGYISAVVHREANKRDLRIRLAWKIYTQKCKTFTVGLSSQVSSHLPCHLCYGFLFICLFLNTVLLIILKRICSDNFITWEASEQILADYRNKGHVWRMLLLLFLFSTSWLCC